MCFLLRYITFGLLLGVVAGAAFAQPRRQRAASPSVVDVSVWPAADSLAQHAELVVTTRSGATADCRLASLDADGIVCEGGRHTQNVRFPREMVAQISMTPHQRLRSSAAKTYLVAAGQLIVGSIVFAAGALPVGAVLITTGIVTLFIASVMRSAANANDGMSGRQYPQPIYVAPEPNGRAAATPETSAP